MSYTWRLFSSIDEVDVAAWERVRAASRGSIFLDPRFIRAVETTMNRDCRLRYVVIYDKGGLPVACTCLTLMDLDLANFAEPALASIVQRLPGWLKRFRYLKMMFCGLPVSTGHHTLGLIPTSPSLEILTTLEGVVRKLASESGTNAVVFREFEVSDLDWITPLSKLGYCRVATPPAHFLRPEYDDLDHYCAALKSRYRKQVERSRRKLRQAGVETTVLTDAEQIVKVYTPQVHDLYHQMRDRADIKFDTVSINFLHELSSQLGGQMDLIMLARGDRPLAFGWCLRSESSYHMMYAGLDYALNKELDLYFNLHYAALDCAFRSRVAKIELGLTAEAFKARLGCYSEPLYVFMKGFGPVMSFFVRCGAHFVFTPKPTIPPFDVFRREGAVEAD